MLQTSSSGDDEQMPEVRDGMRARTRDVPLLRFTAPEGSVDARGGRRSRHARRTRYAHGAGRSRRPRGTCPGGSAESARRPQIAS